MTYVQKQKKVPPGRRPKTKRAEMNTRSMILAAARKVFADKGVEGTSIRKVAEAAKVNNAMIYYYFKDKDDLYRSLLTDSLSALTAIWDDEIFRSDLPARQKLRRYIDGYIRFHQSNEDLRRILAMEFACSGGKCTWVCDKFFADNITRLTRIFREGIRKGEIRKADPLLSVSSLVGMIVYNFIMQPIVEHVHGKSVNLSPRKFGAFIADLFFRGLGRQEKLQQV